LNGLGIRVITAVAAIAKRPGKEFFGGAAGSISVGLLTMTSFCSGVQRLRRCKRHTTATCAGVAGGRLMFMDVSLRLASKNTDRTVFRGANSSKPGINHGLISFMVIFNAILS
jgi:hypothetical protein